jgi:hypothetical protein
MRQTLIALTAVALVLGILAPATIAQEDLKYINAFMKGRAVANVQTDEDVAAGIIVKYKGTAANAQIEVNASGDIIFTEDVGSGLAADASVLESGGTGGTIDVSDTNADTLGEVVDIINAEAGDNWVAAIHAGLRTDSSDDAFLVLAATSNVMRPEGQNLAYDADTANKVSHVLSENQDGQDYFTLNGGLLPNPFRGKKAGLFWARYSITQGTALTLTISSVRVENLESGGQETVTGLYSTTLTSGSATNITLFNNIGLFSRPDEKLLLQITDSGTLGAFVIFVSSGFEYDVP